MDNYENNARTMIYTQIAISLKELQEIDINCAERANEIEKVFYDFIEKIEDIVKG